MGFNSNLNRYSVYDQRNKHIPFLDYDDIPKEELIKDIIKLQFKFKLGYAKVYRSSFLKILRTRIDRKFPFIHIWFERKFKYHVYFTQDPMPYFDILPIIHLSKCDEKFKKWRMIRHNCTLRFSPKGFKLPKPDFVVTSPFMKEETGFEDKILFTLKNEKELMKCHRE